MGGRATTLRAVSRRQASVEVGTGYELLISAVTIADPSSRSRVAMATMLQRQCRSLAPAAGQAFRRIGREPFINLLGWVQARVRRPSAQAVLAALATADPREVRLAALGYHRRAFRSMTSPATIQAAAAGDRTAIRLMHETADPEMPHWQASLRHLLAVTDGDLQHELVEALRSWRAAAVGDLEPELERDQAAGAARARELLASRDLLDVIAELVPGIAFSRRIEQSKVVLVPSRIVRPRFAMTDYDATLVMAFPAEMPVADAEIVRLARLADALGDPLRVRVLRELARGAVSTSELARRLGVPRTSLQHHLTVLTSAGLAAMAVDDATVGLLELRPTALADLAALSQSVVQVPQVSSRRHAAE